MLGRLQQMGRIQRKKQIDWNAVNVQPKKWSIADAKTNQKVDFSQTKTQPFRTNRIQDNQQGAKGVFSKIGEGIDYASEKIEKVFGAPAFLASGGNPLTGKPLVRGGGDIPRGFTDQVKEVTKPVLGDKGSSAAAFASGFMEPLGGFGKAKKAKDALKAGKQALAKGTGQKGATELAQESIKYKNTAPALKMSSLDKDIHKLAKAPELNLDRINVSKSGKQFIEKTTEEIRPQLEKAFGKNLTNKEVLLNTEVSARILNDSVGRKQTKDWVTALTNTRQRFASMAENGIADKEFIETLKTLKSIASDSGRRLQAHSIEANPQDITLKQHVLEEILKVNDNVDELVNAAKGVDFNDYKQATRFFRQFVKPKMSEWIDLLRYNSMLSSPLTHIVNTASNLVNSSIIAPIEKLAVGGFDFFQSPVTGERQRFAGEAGAFLKGYYSNLGEAVSRFGKVMKGDNAVTNLDTRHIPLTTEGAGKVVENTLSVPLRFLEASDQFFTALTHSGEEAALNYRKSKGVSVPNIAKKADSAARYRLYRQDLFEEGQGTLLDAVDQLTSLLFQARNSRNPIVSTIAKFTVPFVKTPMNILKQGMEYSPAGFFTLIGNTDKTSQLAKAAIGSTIFAGAATLLGAGRLTWGEPIPENQKNLFKAAGKIPYAVKIGDTWVSFQKLPPPIAFPLAMVAAVDDAMQSKKLDEGTADMILSSIAKYGSFLSDQSYAKSIGDLLTATRGGEGGLEKLVSGYPQQLIPFRALGGWLARLTDHIQRKPDPDAGFIDKQVQLLMMNIPGLSENVPPRKNSKGEDIEAPNPVMNALLPVRTSEEKPEGARNYQDYLDIRQIERAGKEESSALKETAEEIFHNWSLLPKEQASIKFSELSKSNPALAKKIADIAKSEKSQLNEVEKSLKAATVEGRAKFIANKFDSLSNKEEKARLWQQYVAQKIITPDVAKQVVDILNQQK